MSLLSCASEAAAGTAAPIGGRGTDRCQLCITFFRCLGTGAAALTDPYAACLNSCAHQRSMVWLL